jgi:putative tryptophan/tyrosine transport system substrate-binding protein
MTSSLSWRPPEQSMLKRASLSSPLVFFSKRIDEHAIAQRLPLISLLGRISKSRRFYSLCDMFRRCGDYVAEILHGAKPSDLPVQRLQKFDLVINLKTAQAVL